jgi:ParB/RepB/Spo0J family partition protein
MSDRAKRQPLGRGLAALFGEAGSRPAGDIGGAQTVPIEAIRPSPFQPRRHFAEQELEGLAQSIREKGIVQPLLVRPVADPAADFELVAGERRWRAAREAGRETVPAVVRTADDRETLLLGLVENVAREQLTPIEEARAYAVLIDEFSLSLGEVAERVGRSKPSVSNRIRLLELPDDVRPFADAEVIEIALVENLQREDLSPLEEAEAYSRLAREFGRSQASLAEAVGKSRSHIANTVRLLSLPAPVRRSLEEGALSAGHARALLAVADPAALALEVVRRGLNVRATERLVKRRAGQPPHPTPRPAHDADTAALERELAAALGLRVNLAPKRRGGSLTLHYASLEQLDRVLKLLRG